MIAAYWHIDIGLDLAPNNGGTTTYQALWMDVSVVTFAGYNFCSRTGASILQNHGHEAMVTETPGLISMRPSLSQAMRPVGQPCERNYARPFSRHRVVTPSALPETWETSFVPFGGTGAASGRRARPKT